MIKSPVRSEKLAGFFARQGALPEVRCMAACYRTDGGRFCKEIVIDTLWKSR